MKYMQLNNTDLNISPICLGTAGFGDKSDLEKSFEILNAFVRAGGNFIDTANVYCKWLKGHGNCSEQIIGKWLKESGMQGKVIVATKGAHYSFEDPGRSRVNKEDIRMDLDESCRTLGKDEMDFYWLHRDDPEKPAGGNRGYSGRIEKKRPDPLLWIFQLPHREAERNCSMSEGTKSFRDHSSIQSVESCRNQSRRKYKSGSYTCGVFQRRISVAL